QFEFVVSQWFNRTDHPERGDGHDPVLSQVTRAKSFTLPGGRPAHLTMQPFIFTTGGAYLFQPSISALRMLSSTSGVNEPPPRRPSTLRLGAGARRPRSDGSRQAGGPDASVTSGVRWRPSPPVQPTLTLSRGWYGANADVRSSIERTLFPAIESI